MSRARPATPHRPIATWSHSGSRKNSKRRCTGVPCRTKRPRLCPCRRRPTERRGPTGRVSAFRCRRQWRCRSRPTPTRHPRRPPTRHPRRPPTRHPARRQPTRRRGQIRSRRPRGRVPPSPVCTVCPTLRGRNRHNVRPRHRPLSAEPATNVSSRRVRGHNHPVRHLRRRARRPRPSLCSRAQHPRSSLLPLKIHHTSRHHRHRPPSRPTARSTGPALRRPPTARPPYLRERHRGRRRTVHRNHPLRPRPTRSKTFRGFPTARRRPRSSPAAAWPARPTR